jgi:hypothetical protein
LGPNASLDDMEDRKYQEIGLENAEWIRLFRNDIKKRDFIIIYINLIVS